MWRTRAAGLLSEGRWLAAIVALGTVLRVAMAVYLGNVVVPLPAAYDQVFFHDVALNLLAGKGFVFTNPPWPFIQPGAPTAYTSFLYQLFLAGIYAVLGAQPLAARLVQALLCSLMPWLVYRLVKELLGEPPEAAGHVEAVALAAAAITAFYAYFVYYSATLMTEGPYLLAVAWGVILTLQLARRPCLRDWALWGLAMGLAILLRQVFMPIAALLLLYILWKARRELRFAHLAAAIGVIAAMILPWTVRNHAVFHRFVLLNTEAGQVFWNANHPDLGTDWQPDAMFPIPADLKGANEAVLDDELMRRGIQEILADPGRFVGLSLSRLGTWVTFWPMASSPPLSNVARTLSFGICVPFMLAGLALSFRQASRWLLLYGFILAYTFIHVISWVQIRYRMPVDLLLVPFAALAAVRLAEAVRRRQPLPQAEAGG
jgi:4-amino-4-deoxy-L-arabinose transferase-like glycosyltransferase